VDYLGPVCEHFVICPNKCYDYGYTYGTTVVTVVIRGHSVVIGWSYSDDSDSRLAEMHALGLVVQCAQKAQLEDYWVLVNDGKDKADRPKEPRQPDLDNGLALQ
jgi:hypothetical protein